MKIMAFLWAVSLGFFFGFPNGAGAVVPAIIQIQGRVSVDGTNFTGNGQFKFALLGVSDVVTRQATATAVLTGSFVTSVEVTDGGMGYASAPAVSFEGGGGSGATATATVSGGQVTGIAVGNAGTGYSSPPSVMIDPPPPPPAWATLWSQDGTSEDGGEPSTAASIVVNKGLYTIRLGDTNVSGMGALDPAIFETSVVLLRTWFSDGINGFSVLEPDQYISAVPYALRAQSVASGLKGWEFAEGTNITLASGQWLRITNTAHTVVFVPSPIPHSYTARIEGGNWSVPILGTLLAPELMAPPGPMPARSWSSVASSADGENLLAAVDGGQLYTSADRGASWTARDANRNWSAVASSADGKKLLASVRGGQLYTSTDSGTNWVARCITQRWTSVASSADGVTLIAVGRGGSDLEFGDLYISTNSGVNWTSKFGKAWSTVASSADGQNLIACSMWGGNVFTSDDRGLNWTEHMPIGDWSLVSSSSDGTRLLAWHYNSGLYTSTNSGTTWVSRGGSGFGGRPGAIASSSDGLKLVGTDNQIHTSVDGGINWKIQNNAYTNWRVGSFTNMPIQCELFGTAEGKLRIHGPVSYVGLE